MYKDAYLWCWATCGFINSLPSRMWHTSDKQLCFWAINYPLNHIVSAPRSPVFDNFFKHKKCNIFQAACGRLWQKFPWFCVGPCCQDIVRWPCLVIFLTITSLLNLGQHFVLSGLQQMEEGSLEVSSSLTLGFLSSSTNSCLKEIRKLMWEHRKALVLSVL